MKAKSTQRNNLFGITLTQFAILLAHSKLSSEGALNDRLQGIGMLHVMRDLAKLDEIQLKDVVKKLDTIRTKLFRSDAVAIVGFRTAT